MYIFRRLLLLVVVLFDLCYCIIFMKITFHFFFQQKKNIQKLFTYSIDAYYHIDSINDWTLNMNSPNAYALRSMHDAQTLKLESISLDVVSYLAKITLPLSRFTFNKICLGYALLWPTFNVQGSVYTVIQCRMYT